MKIWCSLVKLIILCFKNCQWLYFFKLHAFLHLWWLSGHNICTSSWDEGMKQNYKVVFPLEQNAKERIVCEKLLYYKSIARSMIWKINFFYFARENLSVLKQVSTHAQLRVYATCLYSAFRNLYYSLSIQHFDFILFRGKTTHAKKSRNFPTHKSGDTRWRHRKKNERDNFLFFYYYANVEKERERDR